jgi:hypothetical protein
MTSLEEQDRPMADHCAQALTRLAGTSTANPAAPGARPALSVTPPAAEDHADTTHRSSSLAAKAPRSPSASTGLHEEGGRSGTVRGRLRTRGAAAAFAALVAAGLIVTDGLSHPDAADKAGPEATPSAPDQTAPSIPSDTPAHNGDAPSASAAPPSHGPSAPAQPMSESLPTRTRPATHPASTPNTSEQATPITAGKGRAMAPTGPPGQARKNQMGKKAAHAK